MKRASFMERLSLLAVYFAMASLAAPALAAQNTAPKTLQALSMGKAGDARLPGAAIWKKAPVARVDLQPAFPGHASIVGQPAAGRLSAQAVRTSNMLYVKLRWSDKTANRKVDDPAQFVDRVAVQFPFNGKTETTPFMGDSENAVNIWHWSANGDVENLLAKGFGTATPEASQELTGTAARRGDAWEVVLARPLAPKTGEGVMLKGRKTIPIAFAVWDGANQERDGLKAVTLEWWELRF